MKGHGLALQGSRPHLHILVRIDRLLPCLHDLRCVFMCVLALYGHCAEIGLAPRAGDICFAQNIRNTLFSEHFWKRIHFKLNSISLIQRKQKQGAESNGSHIHSLHVRMWKQSYNIKIHIYIYSAVFIISHIYGIKVCTTAKYRTRRWAPEGTVWNSFGTGFTLIINPVKPTAAYASRNNIMPCREDRGSIFRQLCKVTQRCERYRCSKWQLQLV